MAKTKIENRAETKKKQLPKTKETNTGPAKKEYRIGNYGDGRTHQVVYSIEQKIVWKSEIGNREEWLKVREWRLGLKAGQTIKEIISCLSAASKGEELPPRQEDIKTPRDNNDWEDEE